MTTHQFLSKQYADEDQFTASVHLWLNNNFPGLRNFYFHIPNELSLIHGETKTSFSRRLQRHMACGVLPGVFDFEIKRPYTWYLELKMPGKSFSPSQAKIAELWRADGIVIELAATAQAVANHLLHHCPTFYKPI